MKKEQILALVNDLEKSVDVDPEQAVQIITTLQENLKKDIRMECARKSGTAQRMKALEKIIKNVPSYKKENYGGVFENEGHFCLSDGICGVMLKEDPGFKRVPGFDLTKCFGNYNQFISLPDFSELKAFIKVEKAEHKKEKGYIVHYDFGEGLPMVNAEFLLNMMQIFPDVEKVGINKDYRPEISFLYFLDETSGEKGLLLPVKKNKV